jgi:hypothetical protein
MAKRVQKGIKSGQCDDILNVQQQLKTEIEKKEATTDGN